MQNMIKKYTETIENGIFMLFLAQFWGKTLKRFSILGLFSQKRIIMLEKWI
jgi:hypothetical protein